MKMNIFLLLLLLGAVICSTDAVTHSLKYFYTASSGIPNFPEYVSVGLVDDLQISHCDSFINRNEPRQNWMSRAEEEDPGYWERQTQICLGKQQSFKANIDVAKKRFNQTGGVHILQWMYSCEWDDETQQVTGYDQYGYDGEDFLTWDMETNTWIAPKQQAEISKNKLNNIKAQLEYKKNYFNQECPEWLKKYVNYGRSSLMRTDRPSVSLLQKSPSSPVSCFASGFYPKKAEMFWRKDGEEIHDGVIKGEINPNNDGTFQMNVDIDLSSVPTEDWNKYECVFQLYGVREDITKKLEKSGILTNESNTINVIIPVVVAAVVLGLIAVIGFVIYKKRNAKRPPSPVVNGQPPEETQFLPQA